MSTRVIRSIKDFARHRMDVDLLCYCGHTNTLPYRPVIQRFVAKGWPVGLSAAKARFKCSKCGGPALSIGPMPR